jgi:hypothetical protein
MPQTEDETGTRYCDTTRPNARRIQLKDGRYMIFFEYDDAGDTGPPPVDTAEHPEPSDGTDV